MKVFGVFALGIVFAATAFGQAPASAPASALKPEFDVASIRPSQPLGANVQVGLRMDGSQAHFSTWSVKEYIARAYRVKIDQVIGPDFLDTERFDVSAKLPDGATTAQVPEMMQSLLADRFQLEIHYEKREMPAYALVLGKSPLKLTPTPSDTEAPPSDSPTAVGFTASGSAAGVNVTLGPGSYYAFANNKFAIKKVSLDLLATLLERYLDRPVVNLTDLKGNYDFTLAVTPEDYQALLIRAALNSGVQLPPQALRLMETGSAASLIGSLQQLGLNLDARKVPLDVIVVDQSLKAPTDN